MPSLTCFHVRFTPSWLMVILASLGIALFSCLGVWQWHRAEQKNSMMSAAHDLAKKEPIKWSSRQKLPLQYQRVQLRGRYMPHVFLLDNQHYQHQFGYNVLSPLILADDTVVLIDRGWVIGDNTRRSFPKSTVPASLVALRGTVYFPSDKQWVLGPNVEEKTEKLTILESLDTKTAGELLQKKVHPFIIRLDKEEKHGFVRQWAIVSMPPQRHLAYAWQWFTMAAAVFIIFIALNLKKNEQNKY